MWSEFYLLADLCKVLKHLLDPNSTSSTRSKHSQARAHDTLKLLNAQNFVELVRRDCDYGVNLVEDQEDSLLLHPWVVCHVAEFNHGPGAQERIRSVHNVSPSAAIFEEIGPDLLSTTGSVCQSVAGRKITHGVNMFCRHSRVSSGKSKWL